MAVLKVDDVRINTSLDKFYEGSVPPYQIENARSKAAQFEETCDINLIPEIMRIRDEGDALFPLTFATNFCRSKARNVGLFREHYPFLEADVKRVTDFFGESINDATLSSIKRTLLLLWTTTSAQSLDDVSYSVWSAWVGAMKEPDTQYKPELCFNQQNIAGIRRLASFMDAHYPSAVGYLTPVKVRRRSNKGHLTGKTRDFIDNPPPHFSAWMEIFEDYKIVRKHKTSKVANNGMKLFASWLEKYPVEVFREPNLFLSTYRSQPSFLDFVRSLSKGGHLNTGTRIQIMFVVYMVDRFIEENLVVVEDGERTVLGQSIVTISERRNLEAEAQTNVRIQASSNPLPLKWIREIQTILTEDDWAWPKSVDSQRLVVNRNGVPITVWNPVCAFLIYSMTELPWRKIQFKSLDSGEGDRETFDYANDRWVRNECATAGHWERDPTARRKHRGVLNRQGVSFCFYVNTNKTADRDHLHGEMSGYFVPWKYSPMIKLFSDLRDWQIKNNPLEGPTRYSDVSSAFYGADTPAKNVEESIPDRFYLFRDIQSMEGRYAPPTDNRLYSLWRLLMDELEKRLREKGEDATIILSRNNFGGPQVAQFQLHGLRVSGLTAFAEAGVPIEILSKLVAGHASILMTIYYLKYTSAHVTDVLSEARQRVEAIAAKDFVRHLRDRSIEEAAKLAVANEDYTLEGVAEGIISTDQFFDTGLGVCPFNGTRCSDGVSLSGGRTAPVPGGAKNCLRCRHFISGEPWLISLALNQQKLAGKASDLSQEINQLQLELEEAEARRAGAIQELGSSDVPPALNRRIRQIEQEIERRGLNLDELLKTMNRGHLIIEQIKALQKQPREDSVPMLLANVEAEVGEYREGTRFELIDSVLQASRIYPILDDESFEMERRQYIDAIMYNGGLKPLSMLDLTDDQRKRAADAAGEWLMRKVGAQQTNLLISGAQTLAELGYEAKEFVAEIERSASLPRRVEATE